MKKVTRISGISRISAADYTYELPHDRIAAYPLRERDQSRLLVCRNEKITASVFKQIDEFLEPDSMMVLNNTKVVQARLEFFKKTGARIEVFCLHPLHPEKDVQFALGKSSPVTWQCLVGNAKKWKDEKLSLRLPGSNIILTAEKGPRVNEDFSITFSWEPTHKSFGELLSLAGQTPLPPYITRKAEKDDKTRYQTVFARDEGSVAAPTAGLHFTPAVFEKLKKKGIKPEYVTLHVGAGTFKPVSAKTIGEHQMHSEQFVVQKEFLQSLLRLDGKLISVGTTSMRTLESLYWAGAQILEQEPSEDDPVLKIGQWLPYEWEKPLPDVKKALNALLQWMEKTRQDFIRGETSLIIVPGYPFKMVNALVTNFHQPGSTLLLLVAAFAGENWKKAYRFALENDFRFLSYGDSCLFFRQ